MNKFFMVILVISASVAWGKTDVRALVSRPKEASKRKERRCSAASDCAPVNCHQWCSFDDVVNKKYLKKLNERCAEEDHRKPNEVVTVQCPQQKTVQTVKCKRGYCAIEESVDPRFGSPKIERSNEESAEED